MRVDPDVEQLVLLALSLAERDPESLPVDEIAALVHQASDAALDDRWDDVASIAEQLPAGMAEGEFPPGLATLDAALFLFAHGSWSRAIGRPERAVEAFRRMIRLEEQGGEPIVGQARSWGRLSAALALCGRDPEALQAFDTSQTLFESGPSSGHEPVQYGLDLADVLREAGRLETALHVYRHTLGAAIRVDAPQAHVLAIRGRIAELAPR